MSIRKSIARGSGSALSRPIFPISVPMRRTARPRSTVYSSSLRAIARTSLRSRARNIHRAFHGRSNIFFVRHLPPAQHASFYASSRLTLNVTRSDMARMGWCPSGRLFEAAACGTAIFTTLGGPRDFFEPGHEILIGESCEDVIAALDLPKEELAPRLGTRASACLPSTPRRIVPPNSRR